jgi:hypothetical protein
MTAACSIPPSWLTVEREPDLPTMSIAHVDVDDDRVCDLVGGLE